MVNYIYIEDLQTFDYDDFYIVCELFDYLPPDQQTHVRNVIEDKGINFEKEYYEATGLMPGDIRKRLDLEEEDFPPVVDPIINPYLKPAFMAMYDPTIVNPYVEWDEDVVNPCIGIESSDSPMDLDQAYADAEERMFNRIAALSSSPPQIEINIDEREVSYIEDGTLPSVAPSEDEYLERGSKISSYNEDEPTAPITRSRKREQHQWLVTTNSHNHFSACLDNEKFWVEPKNQRKYSKFMYFDFEEFRVGCTNNGRQSRREINSRLKTFITLKDSCGKRAKSFPEPNQPEEAPDLQSVEKTTAVGLRPGDPQSGERRRGSRELNKLPQECS